MRKLYLYGYGTCNFYRDAVKLATSAKSKGLIELECKRFIDSASYFIWLSKNKGMMFEDTKSRTEVESHETSPIIWTESEAEGKRLVGGCVELHTYMEGDLRSWLRELQYFSRLSRLKVENPW